MLRGASEAVAHLLYRVHRSRAMLLVTTVVALVVSRLSNWSNRVLAITIRAK